MGSLRLTKNLKPLAFVMGAVICFGLSGINKVYGSMQLSQVTPPTLNPPTCVAMEYFEIGGYPPLGKGQFPKASCDSCSQAIKGQQSSVASAMSGAQSADAAVASSTAANSGAAAAGTQTAQASNQFSNGVNQCNGGSGLTDQAGIADKLAGQLDACASAIDSACGGMMAEQDRSTAKAAADSCRAKSAQAKGVSSSKVAEAGEMASKCAQSNQNGQGLDKLAQAAQAAGQAMGAQQPSATNLPDAKPTPSSPEVTNLNNKVAGNSASIGTTSDAASGSHFGASGFNYKSNGLSGSSSASADGAVPTATGASGGSDSANISSGGGSAALGAAGSGSKAAGDTAANAAAGKKEEGSTYAYGGGGAAAGSKPVLGLSVDNNDLLNTFGAAASSVIGGIQSGLGREPSSKSEYEDEEVRLSLFIRVNLKINKMAKKQNFLVAGPSKE